MNVLQLIEELKKYNPNSTVFIPIDKNTFGRIEKVLGHDDGSIGGGESVSLFPYNWGKK